MRTKKLTETLPYSDNFVASERWVRDTLRKGLKRKSREFYIIKSFSKIEGNRYYIELKKEFKLSE